MSDIYNTYYDTNIDYGYAGNKPKTQETVYWFYGDTVSIEFDLTSLNTGETIDPSFLQHKKIVVRWYNFRTEEVKSYSFSYDDNEITVTSTAIYVTVVFDKDTSNDIFKRGTYYSKVTMENDEGYTDFVQTVLPMDIYVFESK